MGVSRRVRSVPSRDLCGTTPEHFGDLLVRLAPLAEQRRSVRAATVYATHDAAEALAVADRVALLRAGRLVQVGTPAEIYDQPADLWAARLTGPASILDVHLDGTFANGLRLTLVSETFVVQGDNNPKTSAGHVQVLVRPDWASLAGPLPGVVLHVWYRIPITV